MTQATFWRMRRFFTGILAFCVTVTSFWSCPAWAAELSDEDKTVVESVIDLDWEELQEAVCDAINSKKPVTELPGMETSSGFYEVTPPMSEDQLPPGTSVTMYVEAEAAYEGQMEDRGVHREETYEWEIELVNDLYTEDQEDETEGGYQLTGDEVLYVFYGNKSDRDVALQLRINDCLTEKVYLEKAALPQEAETLPEETAKEEAEPETKEHETEEETGEGVQSPEETTKEEDVHKVEHENETEADETKEIEKEETKKEEPETEETEKEEIETEETEKEETKAEREEKEDLGEESGQLTLSKREVPLVALSAAAALEEEVDQGLSDQEETLVLDTFSLRKFGEITVYATAKDSESSLTVKNSLNHNSEGWTGEKFLYTVTIQNSDGKEQFEFDARDEYDNDSRIREITFELAEQEKVKISNINEKATYTAVQSPMEWVTVDDITEVKTKLGWNGTGDSSDQEEDAEDDEENYGYRYEAYTSLMRQAEALIKAAKKCSNANNWNAKATKNLLKSSNTGNWLWNEAYRDRLAIDYNNGRWPSAESEGLKGLLESYLAILSPDQKQPDDYGNEGDQFYLAMYVYHDSKSKTIEVIPYLAKTDALSKEDTSGGFLPWRAYGFYDYRNQTWYANSDRKYIEFSTLYNTGVAGLWEDDRNSFVEIGSGEDFSDDESNTEKEVEGSFGKDGFACAVDLTFKNTFYQETAQQTFYTVTFRYLDQSGLETWTDVVVLEGSPARAPQMPDVTGKEFVRWDQDFSNVTDDMVVRAEYRDLGNTGGSDEDPAVPEEGGGEDTPQEGGGTTGETGGTGNNGNTGSGSTDNGSTDNGSTGTGGSGGSSSRPSAAGTGSYTAGGPGADSGQADPVTIMPEDVPLASLPVNTGSDLYQITILDDGEVPLAALPKTGVTDYSSLAAMMSGMLLALYLMVGKKKNEDA